MKLQEIRDGFEQTAKKLQEINPRLKCHIVVVIGHRQFTERELARGSDTLLKLFDDAETNKFKLQSKTVRAAFEKKLETREFNEVAYELRFYDLKMEAIQEIKKHPIVRAIGKTDMTPASINIVIG